MTNAYVSDVQLAKRYGVHRTTLWRWAKTDPAFPRPMKLSLQCSRWRMADIEAWEAQRGAHK